MDLPTYTGIWKTKRVFYKIEDIRLPMPVPADVLLLTAICFAVWCGFWWATVGVAPFKAIFGGSAWFAAAACWYALPPFFAARMIARPNREGKNIPQAAASWGRYLTRPKTLDGYVSRRHIQAWLRIRDTRARIHGPRTITMPRVTVIPQCRRAVTRINRHLRETATRANRKRRAAITRWRAAITRWRAAITRVNLRIRTTIARAILPDPYPGTHREKNDENSAAK
jgi:hypothetical protein